MKLTKMNKKQFDEIAILLTHSSCAIEGNTFSLKDTKRIYNGTFKDNNGLKNMWELYEIINFKEVINFIKDNYQDLKINKGTILKLHEIIMENLLDNNGSFREHNVRINHSDVVLCDWVWVDYKLDELNDWYNKAINEPNVNKKRGCFRI